MRSRRIEFVLAGVGCLLASIALVVSVLGYDRGLEFIVCFYLFVFLCGLGAIWLWVLDHNWHSWMVAVGILIVCSGIVVSVGVTSWPLRLMYAVCSDQFDEIADRLRAGDTITTPKWIGSFQIEKAEIDSRNKLVCLWTVLDSSGNCGFVQCPPRDVEWEFNCFAVVRLDDHWQFIGED